MTVPSSPSRAPSIDTAPRLQTRLLSLDVLRGLVVLLMLFVNEMAGVAGAPAFLLHVPAGIDGMTITDVVFPAFLFVAGMAIPLGLGARLRRHEAAGAIWRHVAIRSLSLIVMGVFMVNAEHGSAPPPFPVHLWNVLMTCAVLMAWQAPDAGGTRRHRVVFSLGIVLLVVAAVTYRSAEVSGVVQLRPQWWGILGLIGWAYLVGSSVYLLTRERVLPLVAASIALYAVYFLDHHVEIPWLVAVRSYVGVGSVLGSHGALVVSGAALTVLLRRAGGIQARRAGRDAAIFSAGMLAAGLVLHAFRDLGPAFWISKPAATPAWCLISAGITGGVWTALFYAVDVKGWRRWPPAVVIAGENALLVYLLAPLVSSLLALSVPLLGGTHVYGLLGRHTAAGFIRSIVFAWAVVRLCGWLRGHGLRPQL